MSEEKKNEPLVENSEEKTYELSRVLRFILVSSFILLNITYSADVGVIASSKFKLQSDLNFNDKEFATFNSITSIGRKNFRYFYIYGIINSRQQKIINFSNLIIKLCNIFLIFIYIS